MIDDDLSMDLDVTIVLRSAKMSTADLSKLNQLIIGFLNTNVRVNLVEQNISVKQSHGKHLVSISVKLQSIK